MCRHLFPVGTLACVLACLPAAAPAAEAVDVVSPRAFPKAQQPQAAVSPAGRVYLVFGAGNAVYCTASDDGTSYGEPVKVGEVGALALGMRRGPRVAATCKAVVVTAVGGKEGRGRDEDLLAWRSDDGRSWQGPVAVNRVAGSAREGLHQTAAAPDGTVYCVWLDLREKKTQVYGAASADGGASWQGERLVYASPDGSVCECCQPQAAYDPKGRLHVMWRNHVGGARDLYLASSEDHGKTFGKAVKLGEGTWTLSACPMDGGGLADDAGGGPTTVWMRKKEVFRCTPGEPEVSLGKGEQPWAAPGPGAFTTSGRRSRRVKTPRSRRPWPSSARRTGSWPRSRSSAPSRTTTGSARWARRSR
jgi:BNR repeat-like domain